MQLPRLLLAFLICLPTLALAQNNAIVRFNVRTGRIDSLRTVPVPAGRQATGHSFGSLSPRINLPLSTPAPPFVPQTSFARRKPAAPLFDLLAYPARTTVKMFAYRQGQRVHLCTGTLVGERYVLTAAHCVFANHGQRGFLTDSVLVVPVYDQGRDAGLPTAHAFRYYILKTWYNGALDDVALLELNQPIGQSVGWLGLAAEPNPADYERQQWHKFSYPTLDCAADPNRYNGDTLYYERGPVRADDRQLYVPMHFDCGIGQSGSAFIATDNHRYWEAHGVFSFARNFVHTRVTPSYVAAFRRVLEQPVPGPAAASCLASVQVFPNPVSTEVTVLPQANTCLPFTIHLYDALGRLMLTRTRQRIDALTLNMTGLRPGLYSLQLEAEGQRVVHKLSKVSP